METAHGDRTKSGISVVEAEAIHGDSGRRRETTAGKEGKAKEDAWPRKGEVASCEDIPARLWGQRGGHTPHRLIRNKITKSERDRGSSRPSEPALVSRPLMKLSHMSQRASSTHNVFINSDSTNASTVP